MTSLLTDQEVSDALAQLPEWQKSEAVLVRTVELANFPQAIAVVNRVAEIAESVDHHPDIDIRWRTLTFHLSTHSADGITEKDISLATQIDETLSAISQH